MTTTMAKRFAIICLTFALFALGLWMIVDNHERPTHIGQFNLAAPCPQPDGSHCKVRI